MDRIKDKVAIVTACTRGIGRAIADRFAEEGAIVYMAVRRMDAGQEIADAHNALGRRVKAVYFDGDILETIEPMVNQVYEAEGRIDILVNNLGGGVKPGNKDIVGSDMEAILKAFEFNTIVTALCAQYAIPHMIAGGGGSIVNISSRDRGSSSADQKLVRNRQDSGKRSYRAHRDPVRPPERALQCRHASIYKDGRCQGAASGICGAVCQSRSDGTRRGAGGYGQCRSLPCQRRSLLYNGTVPVSQRRLHAAGS